MTEATAPELAAFLVSEAGRAAAASLPDTGDARRALLELRKTLDPRRAAALVDQDRARRALRDRQPLADRLFLDGLAAAQGSSAACADHRAGRFPRGALVAELGCSVGLDSLALARRGPLVALDVDAGRLIFARANLEVAGLDALFVRGRAPGAAPRAPFLYADPDRRPQGRRRHHPEEASPRLSELLALAPSGGLLVKLSPLAPLEEIEGHGDLEFLGLGSELKELVLATGELARGGRRVVLADRGFVYEAPVRPAPPAAVPGSLLYEPHAALVRSGLLGALAADLGLRLLATDIAFLTGEAVAPQALLRAYEILDILAADPRRIGRAMAARGLARVEVVARGFPGDAAALEARLPRGKGELGRVFLTRLGAARVAVLGRPRPT